MSEQTDSTVIEHPERVFVLSGPSGVGKNSIAARLCGGGKAVRAVTATTRKPRTGERNGVDYHFVATDEFERWWREGRLLERNEYSGEHYGTPAFAVNEAARGGQPVLLVIDVNGALEIKRRWPEATLVFVKAPSQQALEQRLRGRGADDEQAIARRLERAREELALADRYDYVLVNDQLDDAVAEAARIIEQGS